jgi:hypothetical protein
MEVTPEHPLYVEGKGWLKAEAVTAGDRLRRIDGGWEKVLAIERVVLDTPVEVYNLTVAGVHTYFVLEVGVLVHNCLPTSANGFRGLADYPNGFPNRTTGERFYGSPKGKFLDELTVDARRNQMALYVITNKGEIRVTLTDAGGRTYKGRTIHHSHLVNGENVYGAGEIYFDAAGQIREINAISGHYNTLVWDRKPFGSQFREYMQKLLTERYGFQIDDPRQIFDRTMYPAWP